MGSATTLYGVNLEALQAAVGSRDEALKQKAKAAHQEKPVVSGPQATAVFTADGGIVFNDVPLSPEALRAELARPELMGVRLLCIDQRPGRNVVKKAQLSAPVLGVIREAMIAGIISGWHWKQTENLDDDEEFSLDQAIEELIDGKLTHRDEDDTYQYGYALESLCLVIGQHLATIEGDVLLHHLNLKTPLSKQRKPVKLPRSDDVPEISYLTSEQVQQEKTRLSGLDLAYPSSAEVESNRREYAALINKSADLGLAIVAFGY